jgi:hypothetical protein
MTTLTLTSDYTAIRQRIALEQALTRQAELILSMLGTSLPALIRPHVVLQDTAETASTDAKCYIYMPLEFDGIPTMKPEFSWARTALLAHELGHWLQPCDQIDQVTEDTGLDPDFVNVVMDVQGEALIASLLPYYNKHLTELREHVGQQSRGDYAKYAKEAAADDKFLGAAMPLALIGRYVISPDLPFFEAYDVVRLYEKMWAYGAGDKAGDRMQELLERVSLAAEIKAIELPDFLRKIAQDFPELCNQQAACPFPVFGHGGSPNSSALQKFGEHEPSNWPVSFWEGDAIGVRPATQEEQRRANAMTLHFSTPKGGIEIMAPGRFDRLAALSGSPMPWTMHLQSDAGTEEMSDVFLAVDFSGSMNHGKWETALSAARSITLAVQAQGGDVRGLVFDHQVWYARQYDSKVFFASSVAGASLANPKGATSFTWLPLIWQEFPNHRVVIITDGGSSGDLNGIHHIPARQRARTGAIVIPEGDPENMKTVAANVIEVWFLDLLAGAVTSVLPRRTM